MSTQILNLDELAPALVKTIRFKGFDHLAKELTVAEYIDRVRRSKDVSVSDDPAAQVERAVELIQEIFPTLVAELVKGLSLERLKAILDFALASPEDLAEKAKDTADSKDAAGNA